MIPVEPTINGLGDMATPSSFRGVCVIDVMLMALWNKGPSIKRVSMKKLATVALFSAGTWENIVRKPVPDWYIECKSRSFVFLRNEVHQKIVMPVEKA